MGELGLTLEQFWEEVSWPELRMRVRAWEESRERRISESRGLIWQQAFLIAAAVVGKLPPFDRWLAWDLAEREPRDDEPGPMTEVEFAAYLAEIERTDGG